MKRWGHILGPATELGATMGLASAGLVVGGLLLGRWLDARLGTRPWATFFLLVIGAVLGQVAIYRLAIASIQSLSGDTSDALNARATLARIGFALQVLALIALPGVLGLVLGIWIDRLLGTRFVVTLSLVFAGLAAGLAGAIRLAHMPRSQSKE